MPNKETKTAQPKAKTGTVKKVAAPKKKTVATKKASKPVVKASAKAPPKAAVKTAKAKVMAKGPIKAKGKAEQSLPDMLKDAALKVLDSKKAEEIVCVDLRGRSPIADYLIIASGGSSRQLGALADYLREAFFKLGVKRLRVEGVQQGDWVLMDAGDVIVHIFRPEVRGYYQLEDVWSPEKKES